MRIGLDVSLLSQDSRSGVGWYTWRTLVGASRYLLDDEVVVFGLVPQAKRKQLEAEIYALGFSDVVLHSLPSRFFHSFARFWQGHYWPVVEQFTKHLDVFHAFDWYSYPSTAPQTATIYDLTPLSHPQYHSAENRELFLSRLEVLQKRAAQIFCISSATMDAVALYDPDLRSRCALVYPGIDVITVSKTPSKRVKERLMGIKRFFLCVNMSGGRKNLPWLLSAYGRFYQKHSIPLVVAGTLSDEEKQLLTGSGFPIINLGYVAEADLHWLYSRAQALIYPSLVEGFGLPILESLASGGIVVTSNTSSMPEIGGKAAVYIDPTLESSLMTALNQVMKMSNIERQRRIRLGKQIAERFTLATKMVKMREVWSNIVSQRKRI
jgi:alpha-1,3-rhamnosyl/mannosyltransferase